MTKNYIVLVVFALISYAFMVQQKKPSVFIIGDSTVQNSDGNGTNLNWGWGTLLREHLDTNKISIVNRAKPGTSSRTFMRDGLWDKVVDAIKPGDYLMMQFGHNDGSPLDDTARARGTIKGTGEEIKDIINPKTNKPETVHTYGWYMRKMVNEAKAKGATVIICSLVPRDKWKDGKVVVEDQYPQWAEETAKTTGSYYINLNSIIAKHWEEMGQEKVKPFFTNDHTHTNFIGAQLNAASVVEGLKLIKDCSLNQFVIGN